MENITGLFAQRTMADIQIASTTQWYPEMDSNYSITEETGIVSGFKFHIHVVMYMVIGSFGVLDNGMVVVVIGLSSRMRKRSYNILILNQSIVDMFASVFLVCNSPPMSALLPPQPGVAAQVFCKLWSNSFWLWMFFQLSAANLWLITVERYMEIVHPFRYKNMVTIPKVLGIIAGFYVFFFIFQLVVGSIPSFADDTPVCHFYTWPSLSAQAFVGFVVYLLAFLIPVLTMVFCYTRMILSLRSKVNTQPQSQAEERRARKMATVRRNLLKTLITVCAAFTFCLSFNQTFFMLVNFGVSLPFGTPFYHFTVYVQFLNSIINPVIYVLNYKEFQVSALRLFRCAGNGDVKEATDDTANTFT